MAEVKYDQSNFSRGELDPTMQKRTDYESYYKGLKFARNVIGIPQGGMESRWGTEFVYSLGDTVDASVPAYCEITPLIYNDSSVFLIVWTAELATIFLENIQVATVATPFMQEDIANLRPTQIQERLIIAWGRGVPQQLSLAANAANAITGYSATNNTLTVTTSLTVGQIYPATFTTTSALPTTSPQIYANVTYYIAPVTATTIRIYTTSEDAATATNPYAISNAGSGTNDLFVYNTWTLSNITFSFIPAYDFFGGYSAITFTPSATSGSITLTASAAWNTAGFTTAFIGGLFSGNGGVMRITGITDSTHATGYTVEDFNNTNAILGALAFLGQPAWSDAQGWPALSSAYQNRLVFARTYSIPNGRWLSVVNDLFDFDDSETLDDNAISWYPLGAGIGYVQALTSCRTLVVHTNTNTQSTPVLTELPITPTNTSFPEQSKFGSLPIQPIYLDNQIIFVDQGNNVINMIWEITQSAYVTKNISIESSGLIRLPVDMAAFAQPIATDGFYALFVNSDGTLANFQSLLEEDVKAWTLMDTWGHMPADQSNNQVPIKNSFVHVATALERCWFLIQRQIPIAQAGVAISGYTSTTFTATAHGMPIGSVSQITFTTTGTIPTTTPQINTTEYWFANALTNNTFSVYTTYYDALNQTNAIAISNAGTDTDVVYWELTPQIFLEELDFDYYTDCTVNQTFDVATNTVTGLDTLNGQVVQIVADGYVIPEQTVFNNQITLPISATSVQVGLQYIPRVTPLPINIPQIMGTIYNPQHVRTLYVAYVNSIGMQIQGNTIPVQTMQEFKLGVVPSPQTGVWQSNQMEGWDTQAFEFDITQPNPLPMTITGLSYKLEIT